MTGSPLPNSIKPILKWAGGKRWLLPRLLELWQLNRESRLVEPFMGSLSVALGLQPDRALLNDANIHLANFYHHLQQGLSVTIAGAAAREPEVSSGIERDKTDGKQLEPMTVGTSNLGTAVLELPTIATTNILSPQRLSLADTLDNISYRIIGLGFPLLTIGIIAGGVWANEAWGSYWSWDPKETWALITWLIFAAYLHSRITKGWQGRKPAILAAVGFVVVWICYLGVNLLGKGLHSYGWFL